MLINDASITGSLIVNASASFQNISVGGNIIPDETNIRNLGSTDKYFKEIYVSTGSINFVDGGSVVAVLSAGTITAIQSNTSSANSRLNSIESVSASLQSFTASISTTNTFTSSATARLNALETTSASIDTLNSTQNNRLGSLETISASNISRISALETTSASVDTLNTTQNSRLNALETTSASVDTLNTTQNTRLTNLEIKTGSLATTGSNTFIGTQTITGSLFISSDLVVQGSSSLQNITASAVSIGTNIINLNTANPAIRYAGLVIGDSGSVGGSGSFLYDSVQDEMLFIHRGDSSVVTSSVALMGPETYDNLGNETYLTNNRLPKGTGKEHLVDSCIIDNGTTTCITNNLIGTGTACFASTVCVPRLQVVNTNSIIVIEGTSTNGEGTLTIAGKNSSGTCRSAIFKYDNADVIRVATADAIPIRFETSDVTRLTISNTGISTFTCQVCSPSFVGGASSGTCAIFNTLTAGNTSGASVNITTNSNNGTSASPLQTTLNFRGLNNNLNGQIRVDDISGTIQIGSMQFYTWNSGQVSALTLCHNSSAVFYGAVSAPSILASGCIGINETSPSALLHFSKQTAWGSSNNRIININNTGTGGDINQPHNMGSITWYSGNDTPTAEIAAYRNTPASGNNIELRFLTAAAGTPIERMRISPGGNVSIGIPTSSAPLSIRCDGSSSTAFMEIATCFQNAYRYVSINGGTGIAFCIPGGTSQSPFIEVQGGDISAGGGAFRIRTGTMGSVTDKLNIAQNGVACFASNVCAANFSSPGFLRVHNTMKTFAISKNFGERESDANYFRISSSAANGYQVMIYSVAQNGSVGWVQSQLYQAATAPYWGGWVGTSGAITTTGSGAGYISSVVNGNDGTMTFRVTTGNNGTTTTGTMLSYIQITAFSIDNITLTAL
jgi:hypothetical protein